MFIMLNPAIFRDYSPYVWRDYDRPPEEVVIRDSFRPAVQEYENSLREIRIYTYRAAFRRITRKPPRLPLRIISVWGEFF